ncbi:hypothetical protein Glove_229g19 [Diversispora epigaea]|uniref:Uncharacterized protein n=1 Tax=Diversispora epigaea TaxID=1348612 RepID=A0A397IL91_9GLOM|nr:hypothetical protein Glove_229g19 [Diversispora epigaea]
MAPDQSMKSLFLPSRTILVQKLPPVAKPLFPMCEQEISSWCICTSNLWDRCHDHVSTVMVTKVNGIDETLRGYNTLAWNSNTVEEKLVIALFSHC